MIQALSEEDEIESDFSMAGTSSSFFVVEVEHACCGTASVAFPVMMLPLIELRSSSENLRR